MPGVFPAGSWRSGRSALAVPRWGPVPPGTQDLAVGRSAGPVVRRDASRARVSGLVVDCPGVPRHPAVSTGPVRHPAVADAPAGVAAAGWQEPAVRIAVAGRTVPVAPDRPVGWDAPPVLVDRAVWSAAVAAAVDWTVAARIAVEPSIAAVVPTLRRRRWSRAHHLSPPPRLVSIRGRAAFPRAARVSVVVLARPDMPPYLSRRACRSPCWLVPLAARGRRGETVVGHRPLGRAVLTRPAAAGRGGAVRRVAVPADRVVRRLRLNVKILLLRRPRGGGSVRRSPAAPCRVWRADR